MVVDRNIMKYAKGGCEIGGLVQLISGCLMLLTKRILRFEISRTQLPT